MNVKDINKSTFESFTSLYKINLPNSLEIIGNSWFSKYTSLSAITILSGTNIQDARCSLLSVFGSFNDLLSFNLTLTQHKN